MHLPRCREQHLDIFVRKEIRRAVWAIHDTDVPFVRIAWNLRFRQGARRSGEDSIIIPAQHVAQAQSAAGVPAKFSEDECRSAAKIFRHVDAAPDGDIGARSRIGQDAKLQHRSSAYFDGLPVRYRLSVEHGRHAGSGERDDRVRMKAQCRAQHRTFESSRLFRVSDQPVRQSKSEHVHWA